MLRKSFKKLKQSFHSSDFCRCANLGDWRSAVSQRQLLAAPVSAWPRSKSEERRDGLQDDKWPRHDGGGAASGASFILLFCFFLSVGRR